MLLINASIDAFYVCKSENDNIDAQNVTKGVHATLPR